MVSSGPDTVAGRRRAIHRAATCRSVLGPADAGRAGRRSPGAARMRTMIGHTEMTGEGDMNGGRKTHRGFYIFCAAFFILGGVWLAAAGAWIPAVIFVAVGVAFAVGAARVGGGRGR